MDNFYLLSDGRPLGNVESLIAAIWRVWLSPFWLCTRGPANLCPAQRLGGFYLPKYSFIKEKMI